ncbi:MAG: hypothetical protein LCH58_02005 [Bacteroidetes bacterium]|nr:hypothetical protein [Bacteroidota bacterium]
MKKISLYLAAFTIAALGLMPASSFAQDEKAEKKAKRAEKKEQKDNYWTNFRQYDKSGVNVFEPAKQAPAPFDGVKVRFGTGFTQQWQKLEHENARSLGTSATTPELYPRLASGFGIAQANLYMDAMLAEGIQLNVTTYLSSHHHNETWVKGGYLQMDKLPFKGEFFDKIMENVRIKAGHFEINYGDQHYRRSDGGHALYNPFIENYIMDAFATEVAAEVYYLKGGAIAMLGVSNGLINGGYQRPISGTTVYKRGPSLYGKIGYDGKVGDDVRLRVTGSLYHNNNDGRSTLYAGDRTGSNYSFVMEPPTATVKDNYTSGRLGGLNFSQQITAMQLNAFLKAGGFELFGTIENAKGRTIAEKIANFNKRSVNQFAIDGIYRVGAKENFFLGVRYNTVSGQMIASNSNDQKISRLALGAGWFITENILMKGEIVNQKYEDFPTSDIRSSGKFNGVVLQAIVGF